MADAYHLNEAQAARVMGVTGRTLASWRRAGAIGFHRTPGGRIFYTTDQLAACRTAMRVEPIETPAAS